MPVLIVVGAQWGDEGKGKVIDFLTGRADLVVRFQGGNNAGHTVIVDGKRSALRLIPSGILRPRTRCLLASGVVLDPQAFQEEVEMLREAGVDVSPERLGIAEEVNLILPYHRAIDRERELLLSELKIGTTGKGIGPAYEDAVGRVGIRVGDLDDDERLRTLVERNVQEKNSYLSSVLSSDLRFDARELYSELLARRSFIQPFIASVSKEVNAAIAAGKFLIFEGAQGSLLDISHGTYPFVTSSNTVAAFACVSAGFGPTLVDSVMGVSKAYCTRVGSGPFPTEDGGPVGDHLRKIGREFGTVTGRPRRCGWLDIVALRRAIRLNGVSSLFVTKLDVLTGLDKVKLGIGYEIEGSPLDDLPSSLGELERVQPVYEELPGWNEDLSDVRSLAALPSAARRLLERIEELSGCRISGFSIGPERSETIIIDDELLAMAGEPH